MATSQPSAPLRTRPPSRRHPSGWDRKAPQWTPVNGREGRPPGAQSASENLRTPGAPLLVRGRVFTSSLTATLTKRGRCIAQVKRNNQVDTRASRHGPDENGGMDRGSPSHMNRSTMINPKLCSFGVPGPRSRSAPWCGRTSCLTRQHELPTDDGRAIGRPSLLRVLQICGTPRL